MADYFQHIAHQSLGLTTQVQPANSPGFVRVDEPEPGNTYDVTEVEQLIPPVHMPEKSAPESDGLPSRSLVSPGTAPIQRRTMMRTPEVSKIKKVGTENPVPFESTTFSSGEQQALRRLASAENAPLVKLAVQKASSNPQGTGVLPQLGETRPDRPFETGSNSVRERVVEVRLPKGLKGRIVKPQDSAGRETGKSGNSTNSINKTGERRMNGIDVRTRETGGFWTESGAESPVTASEMRIFEGIDEPANSATPQPLSGRGLNTDSRRSFSQNFAAHSASQPAAAPEPTIEVSIGRVEVQAVIPPVKKTARIPKPKQPMMSLEEYLKHRRGGER